MNKRTWIVGGIAIVLIVILYFVFDARSKSAESQADLTFLDSITKSTTASAGSANTNTVNNTEADVTTLKVETETAGTGEGAKAGDTVTVQYTGTLTNGQKFDSSYDHGQPFSFKLGGGQVIKGWDQGLIGMKVGEKRKLTIPPDLGYGAAGAGGVIPPNATLIFEVEMVSIKH